MSARALVIAVLSATPCVGTAEEPTERRRSAHLQLDDCLGSITRHPAFAGLARHLLPRDDRPYDATMPLKDIGTLLPYHRHVDAAVVISGLNRITDDVGIGRRVLYDVYSDAEKRADASRAATGLFFFRGRAGAPFAVVAPGGGFEYVASAHEGSSPTSRSTAVGRARSRSSRSTTRCTRAAGSTPAL